MIAISRSSEGVADSFDATFCVAVDLKVWPTCRAEDEVSDPSRSEVLLLAQIRVGRDPDIESFRLGNGEKVAVVERGPASLVSRDDHVTHEHPAQRHGRSRIEEDTHSGGSECAARNVFQNQASLDEHHVRKESGKFLDGNAAFEILEQRIALTSLTCVQRS